MLCEGTSVLIVAGAGADLGGGIGPSGSSGPRGNANLVLCARLPVAGGGRAVQWPVVSDLLCAVHSPK
jgi:hypothetical protein